MLQHTGVLIASALLGAAAIVLTLVGVLMARAGVSLRPIWWFAGLFLIIVLPQLAYHVYDALRQQRTVPSSVDRADAGEQSAEDARALDSRFGDDVDPAMIADVRDALAGIFAEAEEARFAAVSADETVLLARFPSVRAAEKGWIAYLASSGLRDVVSGDSARGFSGNFAGGGRVYILPMGRMVGVWSGPDDAAIRARMAKGNFAPPGNARLAGGNGAAQQAVPLIPMPLQLAGLVGLVLVTSVYFFKGASWAAGAPAAAVAPLPAGELRSRLLAINELDVPFGVATSDDGAVEVTWRYADAKWLDFARAHGMRRTHRVVLRLDEKSHVARVSDFAASLDWSAGAGGATLRWHGSTGITFFQYRHERVYGLQLGPDGRLSPNLSYSYTFNLQEMKEPLIRMITEAGWEWRPVLWSSSPTWLRWLTE